MTHSENHTFPATEHGNRAVRGNGPDASADASQIQGHLSTARQKMADTMVQVQNRSHEVMETASGTIQRWPFSAIAVAMAVGIAVGYLLAERRSSSLATILRRPSLPHRWHW